MSAGEVAPSASIAGRSERGELIRVVIAEDEAPLREALVALIEGEPDLEIAGVAADAQGAIEVAEASQPHVLLQDVRLPGGGGSRVAVEVAARVPGARLIALSAYEDRASVLSMLRAGAIGYLVKGTTPAEILEAIRRAARGQASLAGDVTTHVISDLMREVEERRTSEQASRRSEEHFRTL